MPLSSDRHLRAPSELSADAQWSLENGLKTSGMTLTSLITLNAILAAIVVYGIVSLLGSAVGADRDDRVAREATPPRVHRDEGIDRIAA